MAEVFFTKYMRTSQMLSKSMVSGNVSKYILVFQSNYVFFSEYVCMIKTKLLNCSSLKKIAVIDHITMLWTEKISIYLLLGFNTLEMQQVFSRKWRELVLICFCFHKDLRFTGQQGKGEVISLTPLYHIRSLQRHLDISWEITAESSPLY